MNIYKYFPVASDRMGIIWTLCSIEDACVIEFGPAGTTHYAVEGIGQLNANDSARFYSTHMEETDITFGSYERLEKSIKEVDINIKPKYIFVMASSVSSIIGVDVKSVCMELQNVVNAKLIPITTGGLKEDYNHGVDYALEIITKNIVKEPRKKSDTFNIIGVNIDSFNFLSDGEEIRRMMNDIFNKDLNTMFTAYTSIDKLEKASEASLNIVVRKEGLKAAEYMKEKFNIPYVYGKPIGLKATVEWINNIKATMEYKINEEKLKQEIEMIKSHMMRVKSKIRAFENKNVAIFADGDTTISMKQFVEEMGLNIHRAEILHNFKSNSNDVIINSGEYERFKYLKSNELLMILADGCTLDMKGNSKFKMQISNPNLNAVNIYQYNPFVGFRGTLLLIEKILSIRT